MKYIAKEVSPKDQWTPIDFYADFSDYIKTEFPGVILRRRHYLRCAGNCNRS